jgi:hypothetical protein
MARVGLVSAAAGLRAVVGVRAVSRDADWSTPATAATPMVISGLRGWRPAWDRVAYQTIRSAIVALMAAAWALPTRNPIVSDPAFARTSV